MNQIERLQEDLRKQFPELTTSIDAPVNATKGVWHLDIERGDKLRPIVIQWQSDRGFGISTPDECEYGVGNDEVYPNIQSVHDRAVKLLKTQGNTAPPLAVQLDDLRRFRGLSQAELAERMGVGQANVARIEGRGDDIKVSTLARMVSAMGGELEIRAVFDNGAVSRLAFPPETEGSN